MSREQKFARIFGAWFLFIIYGIPETFLIMTAVSGILEPSYGMMLWGGVATCVGIYLRESASPIRAAYPDAFKEGE